MARSWCAPLLGDGPPACGRLRCIGPDLDSVAGQLGRTHGTPEQQRQSRVVAQSVAFGPSAACRYTAYRRRSCFTQSTSIVQCGVVMGAGVILAKLRRANSGSGNWSPCPALR